MNVVVTGAAGFIGSVVVEQLISAGHRVIGIDNLKYGHRQAVHPEATFVELDILDEQALTRLLSEHRVDAVAHLAAEAFIDDSLKDPGMFYRVNVCGGLSLLNAMVATNVKKMIFSSTAAVYGTPKTIPIAETSPHEPCNPYGDSKLAFEHILGWYLEAFGIHHVILRYFNACGATERLGESRKRETHLIPICMAAACGQRDHLVLYGTDYNTPDGTCVRDYVHVVDIARAHCLSLEAIDSLRSRAYNLGNGSGYSNRQVIAAVEKAAGRPVPFVEGDRRPGDPDVLVANASRIRDELGWEPQFQSLDSMVESAWRWRIAHPEGYRV